MGETGSATPEIAKLYTDENRQELSMIFHFEHMSLDEEKRVGKSNSKLYFSLKIEGVPEVHDTPSLYFY